MPYKYKLKEQERKNTLKPKDVSPAFLKRLEDLYGPIDTERDFFSSDLDTYYKTNPRTKDDIETGAVSHKVIPLASFEESLKKITSSYEALKDLLKTDEAKNDSNIQDVAKDIKDALNKYRAHLRKFYPEQYRQAMSRMDEMSTTGGGAGSASFSAGTGMQYATPYAFRKKGQKANIKAYKELGYKPVKTEGVGATLGPGPKATEDGVKDNAYVKQFKYKLVPKTKDGTYVQKGSGLEVDKLF